MPVITRILIQKRSPSRRSIHLDGAFAFGCSVNVVAEFRLRDGMELTAEQVEAIERGEVRQACFDHALRLLQSRLHGRSELGRKLTRGEYGPRVIERVLDDLQRLGYVDDARFAQARARSAAEHKGHGRRRAFLELMRSGISAEVADQALDAVYADHPAAEGARQIALKQAPRLRRLDPPTARRRLIAMLLRRGFDYEDIRPLVDEVLARTDAS